MRFCFNFSKNSLQIRLNKCIKFFSYKFQHNIDEKDLLKADAHKLDSKIIKLEMAKSTLQKRLRIAEKEKKLTFEDLTLKSEQIAKSTVNNEELEREIKRLCNKSMENF